MSQRRRPERVVEFTWERRNRWWSWLSMRHARAVVGAVVAVSGLLLAVSVNAHTRRVHATRASIVSVQRATEAFRADHGRCPSGVAELVRPPAGARGARRYLARVGAGPPPPHRAPSPTTPLTAPPALVDPA